MRFTASRRRYLDVCGYPFRPDVELVEQDPPGSAARIGTQVHAWIERRLGSDSHSSPSPLLSREENTRACALLDAWWAWWDGEGSRPGVGSYFVPDSFQVEVPIALDLMTGVSRVLPRSDHRDYSAAKDTEVVGTADLIARRKSDGRLCVLDWKTGSDAIDAEPQLRTLALIAARLPPFKKIVDATAVYIAIDGVRTRPEPDDPASGDLGAVRGRRDDSDGPRAGKGRKDAPAGRLGAPAGTIPGDLGWFTYGGRPGTLTAEFRRLRLDFFSALRGEAEPRVNPLCESFCPARGGCPAWREVDEAMIEIAGRRRYTRGGGMIFLGKKKSGR